MATTILMVEDDWQYAQLVGESLRDALPDLDLIKVKSESEFIERFDELAALPLSLILMDVMVAWAEVKEGAPEKTNDAEREGYFRAGLRCVERLRNHPSTREIPIIIHSNLSKETVYERIAKLKLSTDKIGFEPKGRNDDPLIDKIKETLSSAR